MKNNLDTIKTYKGFINYLEKNQVFVFGSNTQGYHGAGTALLCLRHYGAKYGQASGLQGMSYGLITTDLTSTNHPSYPKEKLLERINEFYSFANSNKQLEFLIGYTANGQNLCGYSSFELAQMFNSFNIPSNVVFEDEFLKLMK